MKKGKRKINPCTIAIIKTLSYTGVFGFPLSLYQINHFLISNNRFTFKKIKKETEKLKEYGIVRKTKGRYILKGIKNCDVDKRKKISDEIISKNKAVIKILSKIPWIKMIAITGSVANQNATKDADIDLLFITEKNRLWVTRGFVFLILKTLGKLPKDHSKREICPNIFIDQGKLSWAKKNRNLYIAQNIISIQPFIWRDNVYFDFMKANSWIKKYYKNFLINLPKENNKKPKIKNRVMRFIESIAKKSEIYYMKNSITKEITGDKLIHFNKNDSSKRVLKEYKKIYKNTLKNLDN